MNAEAKTTADVVGNRVQTSIGAPIAKGILLIIVTTAGLAIVYFSPLRDLLQEAGKISAILRQTGPAAPVLSIAVIAVLVGLGCPRLLLCPVAGLAFGFWEGLAVAQIGTVLGSYGEFLFVRWGGREFVIRRHPGFKDATGFLDDSGFLPIALVRQLPVASYLISMFLALTQVRHRNYLFGTFLGTLPHAIPATIIGSSTARVPLEQSITYVSGAVGILVAMWIVFALSARRMGIDFHAIFKQVSRGSRWGQKNSCAGNVSVSPDTEPPKTERSSSNECR
jgi:uncharacterized membrane protein YdjX (TVP38/TMEM64 family)